jgi:hypothetical protein
MNNEQLTINNCGKLPVGNRGYQGAFPVAPKDRTVMGALNIYAGDRKRATCRGGEVSAA